ncbi:hypothetical protein JB92DRAFT_2986887 [Gautieria morchelliformis]|nr:hypothetical protein JB92DRAFT_2986887 [Gautieria morchelliformis]
MFIPAFKFALTLSFLLSPQLSMEIPAAPTHAIEQETQKKSRKILTSYMIFPRQVINKFRLKDRRPTYADTM